MIDKLTEVDIKIILSFAKNNMNVTYAAQELFFARNNVVYHLDKVQRVTGLNPYKFYDLVELVLGIKKEVNVGD